MNGVPNVLSKELIRERSAVCADTGCWNWLGSVRRKPRFPYGRLRVGNVEWAAHRASWVVFNGPIPRALQVLHECDNARCVNPSHLKLGTQSINLLDMVRRGRGRQPRGERQWKARLTATGVAAIRQALAGGARVAEIAATHGVARGTVYAVRSGRTWRHVV